MNQNSREPLDPVVQDHHRKLDQLTGNDRLTGVLAQVGHVLADILGELRQWNRTRL